MIDPAATAVIAALRELGHTVATAESLAGGPLCGALTDVPGASAVVRGGVVSYATDLTAAVLGVDEGLLAHEGTVHPKVARQMAVEGAVTLRALGLDGDPAAIRAATVAAALRLVLEALGPVGSPVPDPSS